MTTHNRAKSALKTGASIVALSIAVAASSAASAASLPSHGHYVSGQGSISKANRSLTVKQSSTTGIINWKSFSIPKHDGVTFDNGGGATLNRVTGGNLSTIAGSLHATGSLYLINSQGVIVSGTGRVVTGGNFVASTGSITNEAFDERHLKFRQRGGGDIVNRGSITAGGNVRLSARNVTQSGSAAGSNVTLRAVNQLDISGKVAARRASGAGGTIIATGRHIDVAGTAHLSASGTQGGKVFLGGDIHGGRIASEDLAGKHVRDARTTIIARGARISANAGDGDGGDIVIWSNGHTTFKGKVSATGKTAGGFAEVSSHELLGFGGRVDLLSHHGTTGTLLLDPENVVISDGTSSGDGFDGGSNPNTYTPPGPDSVLTVADLQTALASANVVVNTHGSDAQAGDIAVLSPLTWSANTLTLDAYGSLYVEAHVSATGTAGLTLVDADTTQTGVNDGNPAHGDLFFDGGRISFANTSEALSINANAYTLENSVGNLATAIAGNASGYYALADNYDASGDNSGSPYTAAPIPTTFTGTFEGLGNTISNLSINDSTDSDAVGLFAQISGGTVRDFALAKVDVESAGQSTQTGALAGDVENGAIFNVSVSGNVSETGSGLINVGGLAGLVDTSDIENSRSAAAVDALGENAEGGGFVGVATGANTFANDAARGAVTGGDDVDTLGGFAGILERGATVTDSRATGDVAAGSDANLVGGFVGYMESSGTTVERSYATGTVSAISGGNLGGFIGLADENTTIETSYATGSVSGASGAGGFVGENRGTIDQSYSTGAVTGGSGDVGGFAGDNQATATIDESYETGAASGGSGATVGGFAGENDNTLGATTAVYFNSNANSGPGVGTGTAIAQGGGLSRTAMQTASNFSGWTFGTTGGGSGWVIVDQDGSLNNPSGVIGGTTPMLLSEYSTTITNAHQLQLMELDPTANYTLANNMDASATSSGNDVWGSQGFIPVGGNEASDNFIGTFDGQGHLISNLFIGGTTNVYVGLFGVIGSGGTLENVIVGGVSNGQIVGGLAGLVATGGTVTESGSFATVNGSSSAGGLVGENDSTVSQSSATGSVSGATYDGGLVGNNKGNVTYSYATGAVGGSGGELGGLVGNNDGLGSIDHSYATGAVTGGANSGVGGIVGYGAGSISYTYATGALSGTYVGGISGGGTAPTHSYWDVTTTGQSQSDPSHGESAATYGLSNADMRNPAKMADFTFGGIGSGADWVTVGADGSVDGTGGTTPMLLSEYSTTITNAHQLQLMALDQSADYTVANDFDAGTTQQNVDVWGSDGFIPIGDLTGTFDGDGHTISNLFMSPSNPSPGNLYAVGLFGHLDGTVSNVTLANEKIVASGGNLAVGGIAGYSDGTISNVTVSGTISGAGTTTNVGGVVGSMYSGSISNVQSSASVGASADDNGQGAGGLVGFNNFGTITQSSATGNVSMEGNDVGAGGLVGVSGGTISQSFATGNVTVTDSAPTDGSANAGGGLVGTNDGGTISDSYALGNVSVDGDGGLAGGFAGQNINVGTIQNSYSLGIASADNPGGFVGFEQGSTITHSYWDTQTSGLSSSHGEGITDDASAGLTGKTTSALQTALPTGFDGSTWGIVAGTSLPYLNWQFPSGTPQVISGTVLSGLNGTAVSGVAMSAAENGSALGGTTSFANGYYYMLFAPGTISAAGSQVLVYGAGTAGAALADNATDSVSGFDIYGNYLNEVTTGATYSGVVADLATAIGSNEAAQAVVSGLPNLAIDATGGAFELDSAINVGSGTLVLTDPSGVFNQSAGAPITAAKLLVQGEADFTLDSTDNAIGTLAADGGSLDVTSQSLTIGTVEGVSGIDANGGVGLTTTRGNLLIKEQLTAEDHPLSLISAGTITESGSGAINATLLTGSSHGAVTLNGANVITDLGTFTSRGTFELVDDRDLKTTGTLNAGSHEIELATKGKGHDIVVDGKLEGGVVKLASAATISEGSTGKVDATTLTGSSAGATDLNNAGNVITDLGTFTAGGTFELVDDHDLKTTGTVNAGSHEIELITKGSGHDIAIDSRLDAGELRLVSAATITESGSGAIDAKTLTGSAAKSAEMKSAKNEIADLGAFASHGTFALVDDRSLTTTGTINAGSYAIDLTTKGSGHGIKIGSKIEGATVDLVTTGNATETKKGAIVAKLLNVTADTGILLTSSKNKIKKLGTHKTKKGPNKVKL